MAGAAGKVPSIKKDGFTIMKKTTSKASKSPSKPKTDLPELVTAMTRLVERLESLERKTDLLLSRTGSLPQEVRRVCQDLRRPDVSTSSSLSQPAPQHQGRPLYQAVCADCRKGCEVPFKPTGDRPVYCKECFSRRKSNGAFKPSTTSGTSHKAPTLPPPPVPPAKSSRAKGKKEKTSPKKKKR